MSYDLHATIKRLAEHEEFKALREPCDCTCHGRPGRFTHHQQEVCHCGKTPLQRGWVPEPDVERACWRVWKEMVILGADVVVWVGRAAFEVGIIQNWTREEAVLRAAEAWLEGK